MAEPNLEGYIGNKYVVDKEAIKTKPGCWDYTKVIISKVTDGKKENIGEYVRDYPSSTHFYPFVLNGKELALYSKEYMYTRVMELPSCKDLGGEDDTNVKNHFCPVEFFVPFYRKIIYIHPDGDTSDDWLKNDDCFELPEEHKLEPIQYCNFGFVAGCVWGDDSSDKIQFLDLSQADKGIIKREAKFGYIELPNNLSLKQSIEMDTWEPNHPWIGIIHKNKFNYESLE